MLGPGPGQSYLRDELRLPTDAPGRARGEVGGLRQTNVISDAMDRDERRRQGRSEGASEGFASFV